jgi:LysM repeat protein/ribosomal protein L40E
MADIETNSSGEANICPRCGTHLADSATRCLVCGTEIRPESDPISRGRRGPQVTISLPLAGGLLAVFALLSAGITFAAVKFTGIAETEEPTATVTPTTTVTATLQPTATDTLLPTETMLPPREHTIIENETCIGLAAYYDVSVRSIQDLNPGLQCEMLTLGSVVLIPYPTRTPTPPPTATLSAAEATEANCEKITYTVQANDTLGGIAANYNVEIQGIMDYNGMPNETVFEGQVLIIPLCRRLPTPGPTPTETPPPPYPAPNLLLPRDGEAYTLADDTIALQWAAVSELRDNEYYQVTVLDVTEGSGTQRRVDYVKDTKYLIPTTLRPNSATAHVFRWWVTTVRQTGTQTGGDPIFEPAGAESARRDFTWSGTAVGPTPTP